MRTPSRWPRGAALDCLSRSAYEASELDAVISCSISKYRDDLVQWLEPPMSMAVAQAIGAANAMTFDLSNVCAGMLTGVSVLNNWIRLGLIRRGMVVSGEYISQLGRNAAKHVRNILSRELASLTLGDAGGADRRAVARRGPWHQRHRVHHHRRAQPALPRLPSGPRGGRPHVYAIAGDPADGHQGPPDPPAGSAGR